MGMGVVIRGRQADELEECVALLALVHKADGYPSNWPADPARWLTPRGMREAWVAVTGGAQIVGHVMVRNVRGDERAISVSRFCVSPHFRGQGLGIKMLDRAREWAAERGRLLVLEVDSGAVAAVRLYEREGWRRTGSYLADWTTPQGKPVTMLRYTHIPVDHHIGPAQPAPYG